MARPKLLAVGEVVVDVVGDVLPEPGRARHDGALHVRSGGSPVNAALAAAAAGAAAAVVGRVGDDWAGRAVAAELRRAGVEPLLAVDPEHPTGTVVSLAGAVAAARGASARLRADDLPPHAAADALLVSGYALLADGTAAEAAAHALATVAAEWRAADAASAALVAARGAAPALELIAPANSVFVDAATAAALTGERCAEEAARALAAGRRLACVTRGPEGAVAVVDGEFVRARPAQVRGPRVGAGDALAGTLLVLLAGGEEPAAALERACAAAAAAR